MVGRKALALYPLITLVPCPCGVVTLARQDGRPVQCSRCERQAEEMQRRISRLAEASLIKVVEPSSLCERCGERPAEFLTLCGFCHNERELVLDELRASQQEWS